MSKYKKILIIPYFGILPNDFNLWMLSSYYNPDYDFLIPTDAEIPLQHPHNISFIPMQFSELKERIQKLYGFEVSLVSSYKLCDYRPAYGEIFSDLIRKYDFWGHCDIDLIFGNIEKYITDEVLDNYDKILTLGHFTLYRNCEEINRLYRRDMKHEYIDVFKSEKNKHFDEGLFETLIPKYQERKLNPVWLYDDQININQIFLRNNKRIYVNFEVFADINILEDNLKIAWMSCLESKDVHSRCSEFVWDKGHVYRYYLKNRMICQEEFMYVHLQKRKMENKVINPKPEQFYILKHSYEDCPEGISVVSLKKSNINRLTIDQRKEKISTFLRHNCHRTLVKLRNKYHIDIKKLFGYNKTI